MTTKKTKTVKRVTTAKSLRDHQEAELAAHLAAVIAHPFTPSRIYNVLVDELTDMFTDVPASVSTDTPEFIERVLNWHQGFGFRNVSRKEGKR